jgi:hypothetical protein
VRDKNWARNIISKFYVLKLIWNGELVMLKVIASFIAVVSLTAATLAHAAGDNCYQIQNQDAKNFCLATAKNDGNYCYQISKQDEKNMCLAVAKRDKNYCYQISRQDEKNMCLGKF